MNFNIYIVYMHISPPFEVYFPILEVYIKRIVFLSPEEPAIDNTVLVKKLQCKEESQPCTFAHYEDLLAGAECNTLWHITQSTFLSNTVVIETTTQYYQSIYNSQFINLSKMSSTDQLPPHMRSIGQHLDTFKC